MLFRDSEIANIRSLDSETVRLLFRERSGGDARLNRSFIHQLFENPDDSLLDDLFSTAEFVKKAFFGNEVFLYGFVYFSTHCRNNCSFCHFRRENTDIVRYRKTDEEILAIAEQLALSGVHILDLTMGEDPFYLDNPERLYALCQKVGSVTQLPLMLSSGVVSSATLNALAHTKVDWFALYQETYSPELFSKLRVDQLFEHRIEAKKHAHDCGMLLEEGMLVGIGEDADDIIRTLKGMRAIDADQVRVMTYIPHPDTPLQENENSGQSDFMRELIVIALMRLLFPDRLIPASLDVAGISGLTRRLKAGANVITSIIPPHEGLAGVASDVEGIDDACRTVEGVREVLDTLDLRIASQESYDAYLQRSFSRRRFCRRSTVLDRFLSIADKKSSGRE